MLSVSRRLYLPVLMLLAVALLVGCGSGPASGAATPGATPHASMTPQPPMPTTLQIVRWAPPEARVAPFAAQTDNAVKVQRLFASLRALPTYVPTFSCPQDRGGGYLLTFLEHAQVVAVAGIPASGCLRIDLSEPYGCHRLTATTIDQIIEQVAETLGVPPSAVGTGGDFYNTAAPGGPLATDNPYVPPVSFSSCR